MSGAPQGHGGQARTHRRSQCGVLAARQDHGQRAWPERLRQLEAVEEKFIEAQCQISSYENEIFGYKDQILIMTANEKDLQNESRQKIDKLLETLRESKERQEVVEVKLHSLEQQLALESDMQIEASSSNDYKEGVTAFVEKRKPVFNGN